MQSPCEADDQDFQPTKKHKAFCRLHSSSKHLSSPKARTPKSFTAAGFGKENETPAITDTKSPDKRQGVDDHIELLPLRRPDRAPGIGKQLLSAQTPASSQSHTPQAGKIPVRAFFTKSQSTQSCQGKHGVSNSAAGLPCRVAADQQDLGTTAAAPHMGSTSSCCSQAENDRGAHNSLHQLASRSSQDVLSQLLPNQAAQQHSSANKPTPDTAAATSKVCTAGAAATSHGHGACSTSSASTVHADMHSHTAVHATPATQTSHAPSPLPGNFIVLDASDSEDDNASDDGHFAQLQTQALQSEQAVSAWLQQHGLSAYAAAFSQAEVGLELVPCLTDGDLKQMGVTALGPRRKILVAAAKLAVQSAEEQVSSDTTRTSCSAASTALASTTAPAEGIAGAAEARPAGKDAFAVLMQQARQEQGKQCSSSGSTAEKAQAQAPTDALSFLMQQARGAQQSTASAPSASSQRGHRAGPNKTGPLRLPEWQLVPGTRFVVDTFGGKAYEAAPQTKHWFLTHFHADHYGGLGPRFKQGVIYCSPITARLVHQRLKVPMGRLHILPLHSPIQVAGVTITFVDAHHCPGAVMILLQAPGRLPLLHTGDCRCHAGMQEEECLQRVRGGVDLVLDTTYCQPQYVFPRQEEVLSIVLDAVRAEAFNEKRTLFLFGSYTIGKEKLFLEVARTLKQKMYVSMAKRKILECLDLPTETLSLLTSNDKETNLHAVPLWSVTLKSMARLLKHYRGRYTTVVGFQPTGWTQKQDRGRTGQGRRRQKGTLITYQVPYSEHSSFPELKEFVSWLRPRRIIPSVGNDNFGPKAAHMVSQLRASGS